MTVHLQNLERRRPTADTVQVMIPPRLVPVLGHSLRDVDEERLRALVTAGISEDQDIDFKQARFDYGPKGTFEISKDIAAMANQVGGLIVIGIAEDDQARADDLIPVKLEDAERVRMLTTAADRVHPQVPGLEVHMIGTGSDDGSGYYVISVPHSASAPHGVRHAGPETHWFCHPQRHGTATIYLGEPQIAARYRDRFEVARSQVGRLERLYQEAPRRHTSGQATLAVGVVPWLGGNRPLTGARSTIGDYVRDLQRSAETEMVRRLGSTTDFARGRQRFYGPQITVELHTDGCAWVEARIGYDSRDTKRVDRDELERCVAELVAFVGRYTAWSGAAGDSVIGAWLSTGAGGFTISNSAMQSLTTFSTGTTADIEALGGSLEEIGQVAYPLARDLSQDMGFAEPAILRPDGTYFNR